MSAKGNKCDHELIAFKSGNCESCGEKVMSENWDVIGHTPGPWAVDEDGDGYQIVTQSKGMKPGECKDWIATVHPQTDEAEHNARLIAAAPELLEALKELMHLHGPRGDFPNNAFRVQELVEKAIAKAEGRE